MTTADDRLTVAFLDRSAERRADIPPNTLRTDDEVRANAMMLALSDCMMTIACGLPDLQLPGTVSENLYKLVAGALLIAQKRVAADLPRALSVLPALKVGSR